MLCGVLFGVSAVVVVGCGPGKELPDEIPKSVDPGEKEVPVPAASEPAAKAYIDKAVKAYTGGKPELVAKGKVSRVALRGTLLYPVENQQVEASRSIAAVWPDRFAGRDEFQVRGEKITVSAWLLRPHITIMQGNQEHTPSNRTEAEQNFAADETAQHWMALFLPLTDPKAIVFDLRKQTAGQQALQTLKLSLGSFPLYQLTFDANTDALLQVEYTTKKQGVPVHGQWIMIEHKTGPEGLLLPGKMECRWNNNVVERWIVEKWEFPAAIDDAEFSPPKK
jgi:hypothetical protein